MEDPPEVPRPGSGGSKGGRPQSAVRRPPSAKTVATAVSAASRTVRGGREGVGGSRPGSGQSTTSSTAGRVGDAPPKGEGSRPPSAKAAMTGVLAVAGRSPGSKAEASSTSRPQSALRSSRPTSAKAAVVAVSAFSGGGSDAGAEEQGGGSSLEETGWVGGGDDTDDAVIQRSQTVGGGPMPKGKAVGAKGRAKGKFDSLPISGTKSSPEAIGSASKFASLKVGAGAANVGSMAANRSKGRRESKEAGPTKKQLLAEYEERRKAEEEEKQRLKEEKEEKKRLAAIEEEKRREAKEEEDLEAMFDDAYTSTQTDRPLSSPPKSPAKSRQETPQGNVESHESDGLDRTERQGDEAAEGEGVEEEEGTQAAGEGVNIVEDAYQRHYVDGSGEGTERSGKKEDRGTEGSGVAGSDLSSEKPKTAEEEAVMRQAAAELDAGWKKANDMLMESVNQEGVQALMECVDMALRAQDLVAEEKILLRVAISLHEMGDISGSTEWHHKCLEHALEHDKWAMQIATLDNISYAYLIQGHDKSAGLFAERANNARKVQKMRIAKEMGERGNSAALKRAEEKLSQALATAHEDQLKQQTNQAEEEERKMREAMQEKLDRIEAFIRILKKPAEQRTEPDINKLFQVIDNIPYFDNRANRVQKREICRRAIYEQHQEGYSMFEYGDLADKAWVILGCTPVLEDYHGSVDIEGEEDEWGDPLPPRVIESGRLIGEEALDGEPERLCNCIVSDDGQDTIVTQNHFMTIRKEDFEDSISTFYHRIFTCRPQDTTVDASWAELGDSGASDFARHLINSGNNVMTTINLNCNNIGVSAAPALADMLRQVPCIQSLSLADNCLGDTGVQYLSDALRINNTLTYLSLAANQISFKGAWTLRELLHGEGNVKKGNVTLTALDLTRNQSDFSDVMPVRRRPPLKFVPPDDDEELPYGARPKAGATGHQVEKADSKYCTAGWGREQLAAGMWKVVNTAKEGAPLEHLAARIREMLRNSEEYRSLEEKSLDRKFEYKGKAQGISKGGPLKRAFMELDTQGDMLIKRAALVTAFKVCGIQVTRQDVEELLDVYAVIPTEGDVSSVTGAQYFGMMVAYPYLVDVVEGGCEDIIRQYRIRREADDDIKELNRRKRVEKEDEE